ncbi:MAG: formate dehydrogenase accessory sulfurtransferase FdhD, partial [Duodenibacillus sp.]|nr:formate dehydrogenase accessory sulfurtransferase FdhD [Duodenibacillus sp.]
DIAVKRDKISGMRARAGWAEGALFLSSRASAEMVRKAAAAGIEIVFAISAPTALAVTTAERLGVTLCAFTRRARTTAYAHPERLAAP